MRKLSLVVAGLTLQAAPLLAKNVVVPGPGTPFQNAIDAASEGATIFVFSGTYPESVTVTKSLRLLQARDGGPGAEIAAGCGVSTALAVVADKVRIDGIRVSGGSFFTIDVQGRDRVTFKNVEVHETCGTAEYGINVYNSTRVLIDRSLAAGGYEDAGFYIGGIPDGGHVRVRKSSSTGDQRGIIVEDSVPKSVVVQHNDVASSQMTGIFLHNTDGIVVKDNVVTNSAGTGIELDATSDGNRIVRNTVSGSGTADVIDNGTGNCWKGNTFATGTVPPCP
jgi:parallel beta-helix repeat protein